MNDPDVISRYLNDYSPLGRFFKHAWMTGVYLYNKKGTRITITDSERYESFIINVYRDWDYE